jgi:hypothetical protein
MGKASNQQAGAKGKFMKISKIRVAGVGCLAAMTGLVTAASMVLTAPADAAKVHTHANNTAAAVQAAPAMAQNPNESGSCVADASSVCSGFGQATNNSVSSGDSIADNGSVASGCSVALDHSTASGGTCGPNHGVATTATPSASSAPAHAVAGNPSFAG